LYLAPQLTKARKSESRAKSNRGADKMADVVEIVLRIIFEALMFWLRNRTWCGIF
jgi:hypothetical protein